MTFHLKILNFGNVNKCTGFIVPYIEHEVKRLCKLFHIVFPQTIILSFLNIILFKKKMAYLNIFKYIYIYIYIYYLDAYIYIYINIYNVYI